MLLRPKAESVYSGRRKLYRSALGARDEDGLGGFERSDAFFGADERRFFSAYYAAEMCQLGCQWVGVGGLVLILFERLLPAGVGVGGIAP